MKVSYYCKYCGKVDTKPWRDIFGREDKFRCNHCAKTIFRKGELNHKYDTNITDEERIVKRTNEEYKNWRKEVYERDGYSCQKCFCDVGGSLEAHHIAPFSKNREKRYDVNNGITLCKKCHCEFHSIYSKADFSVDEFYSWFNSPRNDFEKGDFDLFQYCPKVSKSERNAGCEDLESKRGGAMSANIGDKMQLGSASLNGEHKEILLTKNNHPTVKPIKLISNILRLFKTPSKQTVLDCFMGSGTTGIVCKKLDFDFIGIELDESYFEIAKKRIENAKIN